MNKEELRIGNWVNRYLGTDDNGPQYKQVKITGVMVDLIGDFYYLDPLHNTWVLDTQNLEPIPLTEEYLLKFGFIQVMEGYLKFDEYRKGLITLCAVGGNVHKFQLMIRGNCLPIFIDYVHTLQNICYYLGQDLTFKETLNG